MILTQIPMNGEHPYFYCHEEKKHYWEPSWFFTEVQLIRMDGLYLSIVSCDPENELRVWPIHGCTQEVSEELPAPTMTDEEMQVRNNAGFYRALMSYYKSQWDKFPQKKKNKFREFWKKTQEAENYWNKLLEGV